jgi:catechol 2,3-dioxygenase-like lactoylglutathione lyase family enzyme
MILDHIGVAVRDFAKSSTFYRRSFAPLGIETVIEGEGWAMLGRHGKPEFWFGVHGIPPGPLHIAFAAETREQVRAFHRAALAAGGRDNGAPGRREVPPGLLRRLRVRSGRP